MNSTYYSVDVFDEDENFKGYHYYELFTNKEYYTQVFEHNYGKGIYNYQFCKHIIRVDDVEKIYVVAEQQLTNKELELYAAYCQCAKCTAPWYSSWIYCGCCYGCLKSPFPQQHVINKTIDYFTNV